MTFIGPLEDRIAIRELYDTYADAATRRDESAWSSCWAKEAIWCIGLGEFRGRDAIVTQGILMMKSIHGLKGADTCLFLNFPGSIELTGPLGNGHAYTFELIVDEIDRTSLLIGIYNDEYIKENGKWVFKSRKFQKLHEISLVDFDSIPIPKEALKK